MDGTGILIFLVAGGIYLLTKGKQTWLLFISGIGAGIFIGAIWAALIFSNALP